MASKGDLNALRQTYQAQKYSDQGLTCLFVDCYECRSYSCPCDCHGSPNSKEIFQ